MIGVLDWEMATVGDPLMDLGTALGYWVHADDPADAAGGAHVRDHTAGQPDARRAAFAVSASAPGAISRISCFTIASRSSNRAAWCSEIYLRYKQGLTHDERFGAMIHAVHALSATAVAPSTPVTSDVISARPEGMLMTPPWQPAPPEQWSPIGSRVA